MQALSDCSLISVYIYLGSPNAMKAHEQSELGARGGPVLPGTSGQSPGNGDLLKAGWVRTAPASVILQRHVAASRFEADSPCTWGEFVVLAKEFICGILAL